MLKNHFMGWLLFFKTDKDAAERERLIYTNYFSIEVIICKKPKTGKSIYFIMYENHFTVLFSSRDPDLNKDLHLNDV